MTDEQPDRPRYVPTPEDIEREKAVLRARYMAGRLAESALRYKRTPALNAESPSTIIVKTGVRL